MFTQLRTRLLLSSVVTVAIVLAALALIFFFQLRFVERAQTIGNVRGAAIAARELSLYTQYNVHDTNAYALGHQEHRAKFGERAAAFATAVTSLEQSIQAGVLDEDEQEQVDQIRATRSRFDRSAEMLFAAVDANRASPSAANQAAFDAAWQESEQLADQLDDESQELASRIQADFERLSAEMAMISRQIAAAEVVIAIVLLALLVVVQVMVARAVGAPLRALLHGVQAFAAGDLATRVAVRHRDEIGTLGTAFNGMAASLQEQRQALEAQNQELQGSLATQQQLFATVQQLAVPLLPIGQGLVLLPIIGHVDDARAEAMLHALLHGVAQQRAFCVILDVTGIALINTEILHLLLQMSAATELLGARVLLAGITGTMAQAIIAQDIAVGRLRTYRDLGSAIEAAQSLRALRNGTALSG